MIEYFLGLAASVAKSMISCSISICFAIGLSVSSPIIYKRTLPFHSEAKSGSLFIISLALPLEQLSGAP
jgi:hypothetical protein